MWVELTILLKYMMYFYQNLIVGKAAEFGTDPFYYYFIKIIEQGILSHHHFP